MEDLTKEIEELEAILKIKRKALEEENTPKMIENPDFTKLKKECQIYIDDLLDESRQGPGEDAAHYIFENAMEAVFGKNVWEWINKRL